MSIHHFAPASVLIAPAIRGCLLAGLLGSSVAALAQPVEEITVTAPGEVRREAIGPSLTGGAREEQVSLTRRVYVGDLDLNQSAGLSEAEKRVNVMAADACAQLGQLFPKATPANATCTARAVKSAMAQLESAKTSAN